jgi:DNA-binding FadR family transcriptional regulator
MDPVEASSAAQVRLVLEGPRSSRPARLASVVVEELARQIIGGQLSAGAVLPTEPVLCEQFGFSRTVMREGLKLLEEHGLVRVEQGRGTTVQPRDAWNLLDPTVLEIALEYDDDLVLFDDLIAIRRLLEADMARSAATRLTDDELAELERLVDQMPGAMDDYEQFRGLDLAFHAVVMSASGSEIGRTIVGTIHRYAGTLPRLSSAAPRSSLERTTVEHRQILESLRARDGDGAAKAIAAHIGSAWDERRSARFA